MASAGRILFVTEKFPHPVDDGGQIRTFRVLSALAAGLPVTLLSHDAPSPPDAEAIRRLGVEVVECGRKRAGWSTPWFLAEALFTRAPHPMRKNFSGAILAEIRRRSRSGGVRAIHWNHLDAAQYAEHLGKDLGSLPTVFDTHNLLTRLYERLARTAPDPLRRAYLALQWSRMARFEPAVLRAAGQVLVCSDAERELVHTWGVDGAMVVPNGVDVASYAAIPRRSREPGEPLAILFTGGLAYPPNAEGVRWFIGEVLPEVRRLVPRSRLTVVGKGAPRWLFELGRPGEIEFTGWVDDVRPWLARSDVSVVPLHVGGGTRIKILEAMAAGVPVVSTRIGAEGIAARDGESIVLADDAAAMARAIAELAGSLGRSAAIASAAAALVAGRYDWSRVVEPLLDWYRAASAS